MILNQLTIVNYKNIADARLEFAPKLNCLIGNNGMGKTNVLDAIYYLSLCRSHTGQPDQTVIAHDADYMMLQGQYTRRGVAEDVTIGLQRGKRKTIRRAGKEYKRLSLHIGLLPVVLISPADADLISGGSEHRRRLMDMIISQGDSDYLATLIRYNKALEQRNSMIRNEMSDPLLYETVEHVMCDAAALIHARRLAWATEFTPIFNDHYRAIAGSDEAVTIVYTSHLSDAPLAWHLNETRARDLAIGYTTRGIHRDDITLSLGGHPMRLTASQGQRKTYTVALRLAQFDFMARQSATTPILLLDDVFDRLDATRVENIMRVVATPRFGQIFVTDTNRDHLDRILNTISGDNALFHVNHGNITNQ